MWKRITFRSLLGMVFSCTSALLCSASFAAGVSGTDNACGAELKSLTDTHPVVQAAVGKTTLERIEQAARQRGRGSLIWQADLLDRFVAEDIGDLHPARKAFLQASSTYLRCRYEALSTLPDWQPGFGEATVPPSWALPGDILFTQNGCAVFLRGEISGIPGSGSGPSDRASWLWTGKCVGNVATGPGLADIVLRSGEVRGGLLGNGFRQTSLRNGRLQGLIQVTDETRADAAWHNHFERYSNGRVTGRFQQIDNKKMVAIEFRKLETDWTWTKVQNIKSNRSN